MINLKLYLDVAMMSLIVGTLYLIAVKLVIGENVGLNLIGALGIGVFHLIYMNETFPKLMEKWRKKSKKNLIKR